MIDCMCINKLSKDGRKIEGYILQDFKGECIEIGADELKDAIRKKRINVLNLTLTSDNRLVTASVDKTQQYLDKMHKEYSAKSKNTDKLNEETKQMFIDAVKSYATIPLRGLTECYKNKIQVYEANEEHNTVIIKFKHKIDLYIMVKYYVKIYRVENSEDYNDKTKVYFDMAYDIIGLKCGNTKVSCDSDGPIILSKKILESGYDYIPLMDGSKRCLSIKLYRVGDTVRQADTSGPHGSYTSYLCYSSYKYTAVDILIDYIKDVIKTTVNNNKNLMIKVDANYLSRQRHKNEKIKETASNIALAPMRAIGFTLDKVGDWMLSVLGDVSLGEGSQSMHIPTAGDEFLWSIGHTQTVLDLFMYDD